MKVIVFAKSKGGVSASTLLYNLATYAASQGRGVLIGDLDPQGSVRKMWTLSKELVNPRLVKMKPHGVIESINLLTSAGYDKDFMFIDTPGSMFPVIRESVRTADLVILPTLPNPVDLDAQEDVINIVDEEGKRACSLFVLTKTEGGKGPRQLVENAKEFLKPYARHPVQEMPQRIDYARAAETGTAGWQVSKLCKADIKKIWEAMLSVMNDQAKKERTDVAKAIH
jgi:cellulose biosynthesis protein BcsQ